MTISKPLFRKIVILVLFFLFVTLVWGQIFPSGTWRYKMTVAVETPEGIKQGSAVREVSVHRGISLTPEMLPSVRVRGEAVPVDLGKRGVLFALTGGDYIADMFFDAFPPPNAGALTRRGIKFYNRLKGKAVIKEINYPTFVFFSKLSQPLSIMRVSEPSRIDFYRKNIPALRIETVKKVFGEGVKIKEISIEITDEPVDWKIEKLLPWLSRIKSGFIDGSEFSGPSPNNLSAVNFIIGEK